MKTKIDREKYHRVLDHIIDGLEKGGNLKKAEKAFKGYFHNLTSLAKLAEEVVPADVLESLGEWLEKESAAK